MRDADHGHAGGRDSDGEDIRQHRAVRRFHVSQRERRNDIEVSDDEFASGVGNDPIRASAVAVSAA